MNAEVVFRLDKSLASESPDASPDAANMARMRFEAMHKDLDYEALSVVAAKLAESARELAESFDGSPQSATGEMATQVIKLATEVANKFKLDEVNISDIADDIEKKASLEATYLRQLAASLLDPNIKVTRSHFAETLRRLRKSTDD